MLGSHDDGAGPLNQANLRDDPKQLTFRVGNIKSFLSDDRPTPHLTRPSGRWIKKLMLATRAKIGVEGPGDSRADALSCFL